MEATPSRGMLRYLESVLFGRIPGNLPEGWDLHGTTVVMTIKMDYRESVRIRV